MGGRIKWFMYGYNMDPADQRAFFAFKSVVTD